MNLLGVLAVCHSRSTVLGILCVETKHVSNITLLARIHRETVVHVPRQMHIEKMWIVLRMKYLWYSPVRHAHGAGQWVVRIAVHLTGILYT
jgi:hypothetical protein